jgi:hypothetical protein
MNTMNAQYAIDIHSWNDERRSIHLMEDLLFDNMRGCWLPHF